MRRRAPAAAGAQARVLVHRAAARWHSLCSGIHRIQVSAHPDVCRMARRSRSLAESTGWTCAEPQGRYVRVIDYKSRGRDFSLTGLYYGASLQLPLYASAAAERQQAQSAGMFFMPMQQNAPAVPPGRQAQQARQNRFLLCRLLHAVRASTALPVRPKTPSRAPNRADTRAFWTGPRIRRCWTTGGKRPQSCCRPANRASRARCRSWAIDACRTCPFAYCCQFDLFATGPGASQRPRENRTFPKRRCSRDRKPPRRRRSAPCSLRAAISSSRPRRAAAKRP